MKISLPQESIARADLAAQKVGYTESLHLVSELLSAPSTPKVAMKAKTSFADIQRLLSIQEQVQRHHLGVELVSRISESVLSITKKIQNG